ncbi:MAG: 2Fe-2S iron-sulfur cluster-binding protein [Nitrospinaceae bacterium]
MLEVQFVKQKRTLKVEPGANLREAAIQNKLSIYPHIFKILNCRGRGLCTSCTVEIVSGNVAPRNDIENEKLKKKNPNFRLACQVAVSDNLVVRTHV